MSTESDMTYLRNIVSQDITKITNIIDIKNNIDKLAFVFYHISKNISTAIKEGKIKNVGTDHIAEEGMQIASSAIILEFVYNEIRPILMEKEWDESGINNFISKFVDLADIRDYAENEGYLSK